MPRPFFFFLIGCLDQGFSAIVAIKPLFLGKGKAGVLGHRWTPSLSLVVPGLGAGTPVSKGSLVGGDGPSQPKPKLCGEDQGLGHMLGFCASALP